MDACGEAAAIRWRGRFQQVAGAGLTTGREWQWRAFEQLTTAELYDILRLRALVFVVEQECVYCDPDGKDREADHLYLRGDDGEMLACLRVVRPGGVYAEPSIGRVITHPRVRGTGLGRDITIEGIRWTEAQYPGAGIRINAQSRLERFYQSFDFTTVSEPYLVDQIEHVEMLRSASASTRADLYTPASGGVRNEPEP